MSNLKQNKICYYIFLLFIINMFENKKVKKKILILSSYKNKFEIYDKKNPIKSKS